MTFSGIANRQVFIGPRPLLAVLIRGAHLVLDAGVIRAGRDAETATDVLLVVDEHQTGTETFCLLPVGAVRPFDRNAGRVVAWPCAGLCQASSMPVQGPSP